MKTTLLIDADTLIYQAAFKSERAYEWDTGTVSATADLVEAEAYFDSEVDSLRRRLSADAVILAVSDPTRRYWRHEIETDYKHVRHGGRPPLALEALKRRVLSRPNAKMKPTLEADDVVGILATHPKKIAGRKIVVSIDKDLLQIPGELYNPSTDSLTIVTPEAGAEFHLIQTLTGDRVDGYPGIRGVGPKTAKKILDAATGSKWAAIVAAYAKAGHDETYALGQARVARILRHGEYDYAAQKPVLWSPKETD